MHFRKILELKNNPNRCLNAKLKGKEYDIVI